MTHISDPLFQGAPITNITSFNNGGFGFGPLVGVYLYDITPLTLAAAQLVGSFTAGSAGSATLFAGTGVTAVTLPTGGTEYRFDVPRSVSLTSAGNVSAVTFTITGFGVYGEPLSVTISGPNANTVNTAVAFRGVTSIAYDAAVGSAVTIGYGDVFGLPIKTVVGQLISVNWASALARDAGTYVAGSSAANADTRGTYTPSSASNGTRRLIVAIAPTVAQLTGSSADVIGFTPFS